MSVPHPATRPVYAFGAFVLDAANRRLWREGQPVVITSRVFDVLVALVESAGQPVDKTALLERVWGEVAVEEGNLARTVSSLRKVLDDSTTEPCYIVTLSGRGYQFVAPVQMLDQAPRPDPGSPRGDARASGAPARAPAASLWWGRRVALMAAGAAVLAGLVWLLLPVSRPEGARPASARIVVLPFENLTGDPDQELFTDGLTEEMIVQLSQLDPQALAVIARTSSMAFKGTRESVAEIGRTLDVDYVLEGSARRVADRVRITAQLNETRGQTHIWSKTYDRESANVLDVQEDVARAIAREVRIELTPETDARLPRVRSVSPEAHENYLRGRYHLGRATEAEIRRGMEFFERSISADPGYALPYVGLADATVALTEYYVARSEAEPRARAAALRAIELDDTLAEAHSSLGTIRLLFDWDWEGAERELERAIQLGPNYADAHVWYAYYLAAMGRPAEAIAEATAAESLDPLSIPVRLNAGWVFFVARRPEEAAARLRQALAIDPNPTVTHGSVWVAYGPSSEFIDKANIDPDGATPMSLAALAGVAAASGNRGEAEGLLGRLRRMSANRYVCPYEMASAYAVLGDREEAFGFLERSYRERSGCLPMLGADPRFDSLREDRRFAELLERLRLPS